MKKNGFTLVELLVAIVILSLLAGVGTISYNSFFSSGKDIYYNALESNILLAGNDYFLDHRGEMPINGDYAEIALEDLINKKYMEPVKDYDGNICTSGKVYTFLENNKYIYEVCLECSNYKSSGKYCDNPPSHVINITAKTKITNQPYNVNLSYNSAEYTNNENVLVTFAMNNDVEVSKYDIVNIQNNMQFVCNNVNQNKCTLEISESGSYKVTAYNKNNQVTATNQHFNVKINENGIHFENYSTKYCKPNLVYNTQEQVLTSNPPEGVIFSNNRKTNADTYHVVASLKDGYLWSDLTDIDQTFDCTIVPANNPISVTAAQSWNPTFSTSNQDKDFTAATNAQGSVTYAIQSQKSGSTNVSNFSIPTSSSAKLRMAGSTGAGTYTVVIRATAAGNGNYKSGYKDITMTVTVGALKCNIPTNITIGNDGKVTWTPSSNCSSYQHQISINNSTFTNASSGVDYKSTIIAASGTRTVYVRATAPNSNYTNSDSASKATNVYSVTLSKGTGISSVTGAGNYISGTTVNLNATVENGYKWTNWTGTSTINAQSYSSTIGSNWSYTANAIINQKIEGNITIKGTNKVDQALTATPTCSKPSSGCTFTYQWYQATTPGATSGGTAINGATSNKYRPTCSNRGNYLYVVIKASASGYSDTELVASVGSPVGYPEDNCKTSYSGTFAVDNNIVSIVSMSVASCRSDVNYRIIGYKWFAPNQTLGTSRSLTLTSSLQGKLVAGQVHLKITNSSSTCYYTDRWTDPGYGIEVNQI